jgi:ATP-dependent DNA ligase
MVKIKEVYDADLYCVGVKLGKGKYEGKIGSLTLQTSCGRVEVDCGSGLTDFDRNKNPDEFIGKIIEIQYNKFIQSKKDKPASLYLPRFVEVREDKNTATSYEEIVG